MTNAVEAALAPDQLLLGGVWVKGASRGRIEVVNPATEVVLGCIPEASFADADRAIGDAVRAHRRGDWARSPLPERAQVLRDVAAGIRARSAELAQLCIADQGGVVAMSDTVNWLSAAVLDNVADLADQLVLEERRNTASVLSFCRRNRSARCSRSCRGTSRS
jgi:aldehyde dehydrogenase (NAD+)